MKKKKKIKLKSFDDWSKSGYQIKKGSKAQWIEGKPMFDSSQVKKTSFQRTHHKTGFFDPSQSDSDACELYGDDAYMWGADF